MTASRAHRIDGPNTRLAADDSVQAEDADAVSTDVNGDISGHQAEDAAATAFILGLDEDTAKGIIAQAKAEARAKWMLDTARIFMELGCTPERMREWARYGGYEFLGELADAMEEVMNEAGTEG